MLPTTLLDMTPAEQAQMRAVLRRTPYWVRRVPGNRHPYRDHIKQ
jgi:hypothetical protein